MDSGNSGSFQSSSGEDEFDSHGNGISALLNNNPVGDHVVVSHSNHLHQPPRLPPTTTTASSYMYHNPLSNYFDLVSPPQPLQNHPNNTLLINPDVDWLKTLRSDDTDINTFQSLLGSQNQAENTTIATTTLVSPPTQPPPTGVGKNPRKRSRASRRAPTTVLTTDTSNFRAKVQEYTGIPTPPFSSTSPFSTNQFDLFNSHRASSNMRYTDSYVCKPFPQKLQLGSSSNIDHVIASSNSNNMGINNINANNNPPSFNYYHNNPPQTSSQFNLQNPFVSSFLEPNTNRFPPSTKPHQESLDISPNDSHINMNINTNTNTHPNLIFSDLTTLRNNNQDGVSWQNNGVNSSQDDDQNNFNFSS